MNYKWESEEGGKADTVVTFTITPKSIADAEVVLGPSLRADGSEQTQTVEKVVLDGKELPAMFTPWRTTRERSLALIP